MSLEGELWEASTRKRYGHGAGRAHPSVEWVTCPICEAPPGALCRGGRGEPKLTRHASRCDDFRRMRQLWRQCGLDPEPPPRRRGRRTRQQLLAALRAAQKGEVIPGG